MSVENFKQFVTSVSGDEELAAKVKEAGTDVDKIIALGKEKGLEFTAEDIKAAHEEAAGSSEELSDEDLEKVAGGFVTTTAAAVTSVDGAVAGVVGATAGVASAGVAVATAADA